MSRQIKEQKAQTATELAIFGAILIFVIGLIVRGALNAGYMQNENLKATRLAMKVSHQISEARDEASRNTASILFVEDRLTADSGKYGVVKRTPYMVSAAATHNRNLFMPVHTLDSRNLPVTDVFINGKHFVFTAAGFKRMELAKSCAGTGPPCPLECGAVDGVNDCSANSPYVYPGAAFIGAPPPAASCAGPAGFLDRNEDWDQSCATRTEPILCRDDCNAAEGCDNLAGDCDAFSTETWTKTWHIGCARLYTIKDNHPLTMEWCDGVVIPCPASNLLEDGRFDLDRDGTSGILDNEPDGGFRQYFSWQWYEIKGFDMTVRQGGFSWLGGNSTPNSTTVLDAGSEGIAYERTTCKRNCLDSKNTSIDLDGDLKLENIIQDQIASTADGIIRCVGVMDFQDGDMDFSITENDLTSKPRAGLTQNVSMLSRQGPGTYLEIREGRLYGPSNGQFIRTTQKKDQVDIVRREIQLSNDTDAFCDAGNNPTVMANGIPNPVEVCSDCNGVNINRTCMDDDSNDGTPVKTPIIYVRSSIQDMRGRRWTTDASFDDYVEIETPPVPE